MGKQAKPQTTTTTGTTTSTPPPFVSAAQQSMLGSVQGTLNPYLSGYNANPDQQQAFDLIRQQAENPLQVPFTPMSAATLGAAPGMTAAVTTIPQAMKAAQAQAAQLNPNAYKPFMDPYENDVVQTSLANARDEMNRDLNAVRGRTAAASAFGGSGARGALQEAQVTGDYGKRRDALVAQLRSQGFDKANALAMANTQMQQQTNLTNAGLQQGANQANFDAIRQAYMQDAQFRQQAGLSNQDVLMRRLLAQAGFDQGANQFNAAGLNANALTNVGLQSGALQQLLGIGNQQYQGPLDAAKILAASIPQQYGSTGTTNSSSTAPPPPSPSALQQLLGVGLSVGTAPVTGGGSLFGLLGNNLFPGSKGQAVPTAASLGLY